MQKERGVKHVKTEVESIEGDRDKTIYVERWFDIITFVMSKNISYL